MSGIVRVHRKKVQNWDIYIDKEYPDFPQSKWFNPFPSLRQYQYYIRSNPKLMNDLKKELVGKVLGCWCSNYKYCHGSILISLLNERNPLPPSQQEEEDKKKESIQIISMSPEWYKAKISTIGASEVATIVGLNSYCTPASFLKWCQAGKPRDLEHSNIITESGLESEPRLASYFQNFMNCGDLEDGQMIFSSKYSFLSATPDRILKSTNQYLELKMKFYDKLPKFPQIEHFVQMHIQMFVGGKQDCYILYGAKNIEDMYKIFYTKKNTEWLETFLIPAILEFYDMWHNPTTTIYQVRPSIYQGWTEEQIVDNFDFKEVLYST